MSDADTARQFMAEALSFHPSKDSRNWFIRNRVAVEGGWDYIDISITPKISPLESKEGQLHGQAVELGDMKITLPGSVEIDSGKTLVAIEGEDSTYFNVYYVHEQMYCGVCTEKRCFIRPVDRS